MNQAEGSSLVKSLFGIVTGSAPEDAVAPLEKQFFANYHTFGKWGSRFASLANSSGQSEAARRTLEITFGVDTRRELAPFPAKTWEQLFDAEPRRYFHQLRIAGAGHGRRTSITGCRG